MPNSGDRKYITEDICKLKHQEVEAVKEDVREVKDSIKTLFDRMWKAAIAIIALLVALLGERAYSHRGIISSVNSPVPTANASANTR